MVQLTKRHTADRAARRTLGHLFSRLQALPPWLAAPVALAAVLIAVDGQLLLGDVVYARDAARMHFPTKAYLVERLLAGELPLWYPYEALGVPFIAGAVTAVFHPFTVVLLVLGPARGLTLSVLLSVVAAFSGTRLLARRLGMSETGAILAAVVASANGAFVSSFDNVTFLWGFSAFPWFLWGVHRALTHELRRGVAFSSLALAWALLAGDVQAAYLMGLAGLPFALVYGSATPARSVATLASIGILGAGLSAVQLLPSVSLLGELARGAGVAWDNASDWSMHPLRIPELFFGDLIGYVPRGETSLHLLDLEGRAPWQITVFGGGLTFLLITTALAVRDRTSRRGMLFLGLGAAIGIWLALGHWGGLYRFLYDHAPLWSGFRYPEKLLPYALLFLALLAGLGLDAGLSRPRTAARVAWAVAGLTALISLTAHLNVSSQAGLGGYLKALASGTFRATLLAGASASFLTIAHRWQWRGWQWSLGCVMVLVVILELGHVNGRVLELTATDPELLELPNPVAKTVAERLEQLDRPARLTSHEATRYALGLDVPGEYGSSFLGSALWNRLALLPSHSSDFGIEATTHYLPAHSLRHRELASERPTEWLLRTSAIFNGRLAVVDVESFAELNLPRESIIADFSEVGLLLAENAGALPRAWVAQPRFVEHPSEARSGLEEAAVRSGREALVETNGSDLELGNRDAPTPATVSYPSPEHVVVEATGPGVLVLNDSWFPGWIARVDGREVPVHRVNYLVRGVLLGPGQHKVSFEYPVPTALWTGLLVSLLSLLGLAWLNRPPAPKRTGCPRKAG